MDDTRSRQQNALPAIQPISSAVDISSLPLYPSRRRNAGTSNAESDSRSISPASSAEDRSDDPDAPATAAGARSSDGLLAIERRPISIAGTGTSIFSFRCAV